MSADQLNPQPPEAPPPTREEVAALVRTIQQDVATKAKTLQDRQVAREARKPRSRIWYVVLVLAVAANAYVWIGRPAWLVGDQPGLNSPAEREGVLRFRMYVQGQRIESYRMENGVLPAQLELTGTPFEGMRYQATGPASWELYGELGEVQLLLRSSQPMDEFLRGLGERLGANGQ